MIEAVLYAAENTERNKVIQYKDQERRSRSGLIHMKKAHEQIADAP